MDIAASGVECIGCEEAISAGTLLAARRHPADVAEQLGFADGRSFARAFKMWNGTTPARYAGARRPEPPA